MILMRMLLLKLLICMFSEPASCMVFLLFVLSELLSYVPSTQLTNLHFKSRTQFLFLVSVFSLVELITDKLRVEYQHHMIMSKE